MKSKPQCFKLERLEFINTVIAQKPSKYKLATCNVESILFDLVREDKYEPTITLDPRNRIKSINVKVTLPGTTGCDREFIFNVADFNSVGEMAVADVDNAGIYKNFARAQKHFSTAIMNRRTISQYSPEVTKLIECVQNSPVYELIHMH